MNRIFSCEDSRRYLFSPDTADSRHGICFLVYEGNDRIGGGIGLIITIERIIHSTYTLTADGKLVVYYGRFL